MPRFNSMSALPYIPYNILTYLATQESAENFWKMLKYSGYDALSKPNLTFDEKLALIWRFGPQEDYSVFFTNLVEDAIPTSKCILKLYDYYVHASEIQYGTVVYAFDFLFGGQMSLVDYNGVPVSRADLFINTILSTLNGAYVGGVGTLVFHDDLSRYTLAKSVIGNSKTFTGVCLYMSVMVGDEGVSTGCGDGY